MTDCHISAQIIQQAIGQPPSAEQVRALVQRYEELVYAHLLEREGEVLTGVEPILAYFHGHDDYVSLLLTGNTTIGAQAKLTRYKLAKYFDFKASGFGDTCYNRLELAKNALANATKHYPLAKSKVFVIGDTPNDIICGKSIHAYTIAVATGTYRVDQLLSHEPWWAVPHLPSPTAFAEKIKNAGIV
jgi:phosphoglycolate phosphatase-like HAD superfamily hydrolase